MLQEELITQAKNNAKETDRHIEFELGKLCDNLTIDQVEQFARETGFARLIKLTQKHRAGNYPSRYTEERNLLKLTRMVYANIRMAIYQ